MSWQGIEGHDELVERFRLSLERGRLASTFLFVGPEGVGKRTFALKLAKALLCQETDERRLEPCGRCPSCVQVEAGTHPDLFVVSKPAERSFIPLELLIGKDDRRMQEGLCHDISLKPLMGGRRVAIIDDADFLNEEGANCLLKTLEEPPPRSVMILIGTSADRQLPTIRSRAQLVRFRPLADKVVADLLLAQGAASDADEAARLAARAEGSLTRAGELADQDLWAFRGKLLARLAEPALASVGLAREVASFIDEAGKEAPPRRARARQLVGFAVDFYRQVARRLHGMPSENDQELSRMVERAIEHSPGGYETAVRRAERSLEALEHIDRNANQAAWLECWLDDLARA